MSVSWNMKVCITQQLKYGEFGPMFLSLDRRNKRLCRMRRYEDTPAKRQLAVTGILNIVSSLHK